jgi:hypothetical protein
MARMLACNGCGVMWRLKDYPPTADPMLDMELIEVIERHMGQAQDKNPDAHKANLFYVDDKSADLLDVESALQKELADVNVFIRETRDDLKVEALRCFNRHHRPKGGCPDWEHDSKIIGRKTGVAKEDRQYLCHFCPVASHVAFRERQQMGLYDK